MSAHDLNHVSRGGSWRIDAWYARMAYPDFDIARAREYYQSFRLARRGT